MQFVSPVHHVAVSVGSRGRFEAVCLDACEAQSVSYAGQVHTPAVRQGLPVHVLSDSIRQRYSCTLYTVHCTLYTVHSWHHLQLEVGRLQQWGGRLGAGRGRDRREQQEDQADLGETGGHLTEETRLGCVCEGRDIAC